jgi:hypothetical protein
MTTWSQINSKIDLFAGETTDSPLFPEALRIEAWNWAQDLFCTHTPRQREMTAVIDSGGRSVVLPEDFYAIEGIYDSDNEQWWWPMSRNPGDVRSLDDSMLEFWLWGEKLYLEEDITFGSDDLTLLYWAYWPAVEYTTDGSTVTITQQYIYVPRWAELALMHLCISSCMVPEEIFSSDINQYKIKIESGDPLDNPRMQSAKWHLEMYEKLTDKHVPARMVEVT